MQVPVPKTIYIRALGAHTAKSWPPEIWVGISNTHSKSWLKMSPRAFSDRPAFLGAVVATDGMDHHLIIKRLIRVHLASTEDFRSHHECISEVPEGSRQRAIQRWRCKADGTVVRSVADVKFASKEIRQTSVPSCSMSR
ncbi:hypothetical protein IG631_20720 [Alternaria alternata]|nr:hypothetical protein IG631_20720 [Alternaria alternata]